MKKMGGGAAFVACVALAPCGIEARDIVSCFYPNTKCEGDDGDFGVSCTYTEANECPNAESDRALHLDECVEMTRGGSRMVTCAGPWWPWLAYVMVLGLIITAIVRYWRHVQASERMEEYLDSLPWYHNAKPAIHSAEIKVVDAGHWLAKNAVSAEHYISKQYHKNRGQTDDGWAGNEDGAPKDLAEPDPATAGAQPEPEPELETQPLTASAAAPPQAEGLVEGAPPS